MVTSTENTPAHEAPRWFLRVLPVSTIVLVALGLAVLVSPSVREQVVLSASHRPQQYVELFFARTPSGTQVVCTSSGGAVRVSFAVTSHLADPRDLAYDVSVGATHAAATVSVTPGRTTEVTRSFVRPSAAAYDVAVSLPDLDQQLLAHCPGARP